MNEIIAEGLSDVRILRSTNLLILKDLLHLFVRNHEETITLDQENKALESENTGFKMFGFP
jgi:hypothetical protein